MSEPPTGTASDEGLDDDGRIFTTPFVTLLFSNGLLRICTFMLTTLVPLDALHRGLSPVGAGLTTTLYMGAAVLTRPWSGRLVDARGRWIVILAGSTIFAVATGFSVLALPAWLFFADRALQGVGFSMNGTAVMTLATDIIPERRMVQGISYLGVEQTVAQIFAPWFSLVLLTTVGYGPAFTVVFAMSLANLLVRFPLARTARRLDAERRARRRDRAEPAAAHSSISESEARASSRQPRWSRLIERGAWKPALVMGLIMLGTITVSTFLAAYAIRRGVADAGVFFVASGVAVAAARFGAPSLARRLGKPTLIVPAIGAIAVSLVLAAWTPDSLVLALAGAFFGLGMGVANPALNALAVLAADRSSRGLANSTFFMAMDLANAVGAFLFGIVATVAGFGTVFLVAAAVVVSAGATFAGMRRRGLISA